MSSKLKKVLNFYEEATNVRLKTVCDAYGARVYAKLRLADIFPIEGSGITDRQYRFALQAHLDFVVANEQNQPLFAVEFDGPSHKSTGQKERDAMKNGLCQKFALPMLRVNAKYLVPKYRGMDLLSWFIKVWFLQEDFYKAQEDGSIPEDEIFDPGLILAHSVSHLQSGKGLFPYWLSRPLQAQIQRLHEAGKCVDRTPNHIIGQDDKGDYHALCWLRMTEEEVVLAETGMRRQGFPIHLCDILWQIAVYELYEELKRFLRAEAAAHDLEHVRTRVAEYRESYLIREDALASGSLSSTSLADQGP